jgi:hypothetical protein
MKQKIYIKSFTIILVFFSCLLTVNCNFVDPVTDNKEAISLEQRKSGGYLSEYYLVQYWTNKRVDKRILGKNKKEKFEIANQILNSKAFLSDLLHVINYLKNKDLDYESYPLYNWRKKDVRNLTRNLEPGGYVES